MLSRLFGRKTVAVEPLDYDQAKQLLQDPDPAVRRAVARRHDVQPEVLYYLAEDKVAEIRREVAANPCTPLKADLLLAGDENEDVRFELARKIGRLLPNLSTTQTSRLRELTIETIETLARDALPRVRAALAEEVKNSTLVSHELVIRLASDIETIVSTPVLQYSPLLSEVDLLEIIRSGVGSAPLTAIARRQGIVPSITDALAQTRDSEAVAAMLANPSAQIREETLDMIAETAEQVEAWHTPLVQRPELSVRAMRRISQFVASSLLTILVERHGLPEDLADELRRALRKRVEQIPLSDEADASRRSAADRVAELHAAGRLDDEALLAATEASDREFVLRALALRSKLELGQVQTIIDSRAAKAITSLAWKAGLAMRTAIRIQVKIGLLTPQQVLYARHGVDYPLGEAEMQRQLDYYLRLSA